MFWTIAAIILIGLTWRLWTGVSTFPKVPLLETLISVPLFADWIAMALLMFSVSWMISSAVSETWRPTQSYRATKPRTAASIFLAAMLCLFLLNQHRLQPWAWQFSLYAVLMAVLGKKFDYQFIYGLGGRLAETLTKTIGVAGEEWLNSAALAMPIFELLVAVLLISVRTRKIGVVMAVVFHGALIATLGPWGLNHHTGVLVWNLFFLLLTATLFWPTPSDQTVGEPIERRTSALILTVVLVLYPLLPQVDHWLAWGLYSPNNSRCDLEVIQQDEEGGIAFERIDLGQLSLQQLNVPLYPEARFQLGVATKVQTRRNLENSSRVVIRGKSDRLTGERDSTVFEKDGVWGKEKDSFIFNWKVRDF